MKKNVTVIKFGGSLTKNKAAMNRFFKDMAVRAKMEQLVLVHGGGPEINAMIERLKLKVHFVKGRRVTDVAVLEVVEMVLSGKVNKYLVSELQKKGVNAVGISGKDGGMVSCKHIKSLGLVGEPLKADPKLVKKLSAAGYLPVISCICAGPRGQTLNVNADSVAMAVAGALKATRLVLMTDVPGVLDSRRRRISKIAVKNIERLIDDEIVTGGMIPKLRACANAVKHGVGEVWVADGHAGIAALKGTVIKND